jgi:hypothetical protein
MNSMLLDFSEEVVVLTKDPQWYAGWGTLALINAGLAQGKHRSGLGWFLGSLLIGPLATLLIVLLDDPTAREG